MTHTIQARWVMGLSTAGFLFASYASGIKFFTETCAFNEPCPYVFGIPACYIGFVLFTILFLSSIMHLRAGNKLTTVRTTALVGMLFAGYFSMTELPDLLARGVSDYTLGLPTCMLGFIFYVLIFAVALIRTAPAPEVQ